MVVQSLSCVRLSVTPWTAEHQASLFFSISQSLLKLMFIDLVLPPNHLFLCNPLLLLPSIFPSIRVFSSKSALQVAKVLKLQLDKLTPHPTFLCLFEKPTVIILGKTTRFEVKRLSLVAVIADPSEK